VRIGFGNVVLQREHYTAPIDIRSAGSGDHHLQLSIAPRMPRSAGCFPDMWGPERFEPMGDLFLLPAGSALHARGQGRVLQTLVCRLDPGSAAQWLGTDIQWTESRLKHALDITNRDIRLLMHKISAELQNPGFASELKIELIVAQTCIELTRYFCNIDMKCSSRGLPRWRQQLIEDCVGHDPGGTDLAALAGLCGLSVRHLARAFRASTGRSLGDYIAEHRVRLACEMLARGASVKETAHAAGFSAPSNFATSFRRDTGYSPKQYRDQQRAEAGGGGRESQRRAQSQPTRELVPATRPRFRISN
jgi:AraC family transcriptional regulator